MDLNLFYLCNNIYKDKNIAQTMKQTKENNTFPLIEKYNLDCSNIEIISNNLDVNFSEFEKLTITEKLLEAHALAKTNVLSGNITKRGFATNVCTKDNYWSLGTNFNNTRNDISSICGERTAILKAYNEAMIRYMEENKTDAFDFKIKYLCMSSNIDLNEQFDLITPCEDCLAWFNTNRYFDDSTLIFSFINDSSLKISAQKLVKLLPYRNIKTANIFNKNKKINITNSASGAIEKYNLTSDKIDELILKTFEKYKNNKFHNISGQNIAAGIISNTEIFCASKIDWTKRWYIEPLEYISAKAIEKYGLNTQISAICYFGDEYTKEKIQDGVISIKTLGRIRQKYAKKDTILILNLENEILITTLNEYLPKKFIQGYTI